MNLYGYAGNNPINATDPLGFAPLGFEQRILAMPGGAGLNTGATMGGYDAATNPNTLYPYSNDWSNTSQTIGYLMGLQDRTGGHEYDSSIEALIKEANKQRPTVCDRSIPDYIQLSVQLWPLGPAGSFSLDYYGHAYFSKGVGIGGTGASLTGNWLFGSRPSEQELTQFLSGDSGTLGGGYIFGAQLSGNPDAAQGNGTGTTAGGIGIFTPGGGFTVTH